VLTGERVTLRPVSPDDLPTLYAWRIDLDTWSATTDQAPYGMTFELYRERAEAKARNEVDAEFVAEVDGTVVGRGGLFAFDVLARNAEVGMAFGPEHRGKGYGTETLRLLVDFGFRHRNLRRIWLETLASNTAAVRCYTKAGFVEEGRLREQAWVAGAYEDMLRMGLLRSEWIASTP
jgi:RimJ/RimL family protein N-acetyltransferase